MNDPQQDLTLKLKEANNILVTVSANPSVDQLAAAIGITLLLNKLKKHATAVFSGNIPSTIEFLKPEETLEKNTDSLRDFIIALDKSKADKLRYKVEENIVKIFITPYKTSITQDDLDFSQGDFNVDVVLALGVKQQQDLDQAITAHGRILHDASVVSINTQPGSELGTINWTKPEASSLSELAVEVADSLGKELVDAQIATALLTGIVAETERFSNEKTSPDTMRLSAELMSAGANQQLVASELQQPSQDAASAPAAANEPTTADEPAQKPKNDDGTLEIAHSGEPEHQADTETAGEPTEAPDATPQVDAAPDQSTGEQAEPASNVPLLPPSEATNERHIIGSPAADATPLTANTVPEDAGEQGSLPDREPDLPIYTPGDSDVSATPSVDATSEQADDAPLLDLPQPVAPTSDVQPSLPPAEDSSDGFLPLGSEPANQSVPVAPPAFNPDAFSDPTPNPVTPPTDQLGAYPPLSTDGTLADIEQSLHSPHVEAAADTNNSVDAARDAVLDAINSTPTDNQPLPPKADVGASGYLNVQDLPGIADPPLAEPTTPLEPTALALPFTPAVQPVPYVPEPLPGNTPADTPLTMPLPPTMTPPSAPTDFSLPPSPAPGTGTPPPPPVPPPMTDLPPFVKP